MRPLTRVIPVALLSLLAACSTSSTPVDSTTAPPTTEAPTTQAPTSEAAPTSGAAPTTAAGGAPTAAAGGATLDGGVEKFAFTITLKDDKGAPVTTLPAGSYQFKIKDPSTIHNFHLTGPGGIDLTTTVPETKDITWPVKLVAGTYTYKCDPHPNMVKTFTVT
ncbi:MAG: hypothetical protein QOF35_1178 [Actinomycetota bacterium]|nr:hypothetical protein [Actinomycetota bacterium]